MKILFKIRTFRSHDRKAIDESIIFLSGDLSDLAPPLPISNREVKQVSVDDSSWATDCESRSSPGKQNILQKWRIFCGDNLLR